MDESYFDIDIERDNEIKEQQKEETCYERCHRWANYDAVLFFGCLFFLLFLMVMMIFLIVWAISNK
jgi:hypothetical protein